jgi:hypothetical protein
MESHNLKCEMHGSQLKCLDQKNQHVNLVVKKSDSYVTKTTITIGGVSFPFLLFIIGMLVYGKKLSEDYGSTLANYILAGILVIAFTAVCILIGVLMAIPILGQIMTVISFRNDWYGSVIELFQFSESTWLSSILFNGCRILGIIGGVIIIIVIVLGIIGIKNS